MKTVKKNSKRHLKSLHEIRDKWQIEDEKDYSNSQAIDPNEKNPRWRTYTRDVNKRKLRRKKEQNIDKTLIKYDKKNNTNS